MTNSQIISSADLAEIIDGMDARGASKLMKCGFLHSDQIGRGFYSNLERLAILVEKVPTIRLTPRGRELLNISNN